MNSGMNSSIENLNNELDRANQERSREMDPQLASRLRTLTPARIGLRKTGISLQTSEVLDFQLAHARARDAVHAPLDMHSLTFDLQSLHSAESKDCGEEILFLHSEATDRTHYLQRPDLGRNLNRESLHKLKEKKTQIGSESTFDLSLVIADGLSALAVERHATPLLAALLPLLASKIPALQIAPIAVVEQARVAIGDEIGKLLSAAMVVVLIGERPGLSSPDSLGIYITWLKGNEGRITDAQRNCISNVRAEGLSYEDAAKRLWYYIQEGSRGALTGVSLKDPEAVAKALPRGDELW